MPVFFDRAEAAHLLAHELMQYKGLSNALILGLAHGGAILAATLAKELKMTFNVLTPRKIGAPANPELAIGAVAQDGNLWLNTSLVNLYGLSPSWIEKAQEKELARSKELASLYAKTKPLPSLSGKIIILVDDGIATGATLFVTIQSLAAQGIAQLIVAAPVAAQDIWNKIRPLAHQGICLHVVEDFLGVSSFYNHFEPVDDATVLHLLRTS